MRKIAINMKLAQHFRDRLAEVARDWEIHYVKDSNHWEKHLKEAEILLNWDSKAEESCLSADTTLRWVHTWGAGVNGMPMEEFQDRGIVLTNSRGVHANPISETILGMMLSFRRLLHVYTRNQIKQKWDRSGGPGEMHGETAGIMGIGEIGLETARLAKAFNMKVVGLRHSAKPAAYVDKMYSIDQLPQLLYESDYVINTLPLTKDTKHFMGKDQFAEMKPTAYYINIGRGQTTDTSALLHALQTKQIAGAGLDVFEQEPLPEDHPLWQLENVIMTPHSSGETQYYQQRAFDIFFGNLQDYLTTGAPTRNLVDLSKQY